MKQGMSVVDLFAGCGGLSLGLEQAGFHPVFVNELNKDALESYLLNRQERYHYLRSPEFHCNDVKDLVVHPDRMDKLKASLLSLHRIDVTKGDLDLVVGGPPCQGYSGIGHRRSYSVDREQLPSNHLYQDMAYVVKELRPKIFLFENVKGLLYAKWTGDGAKGEIWRDVLKTFKDLKEYSVEPALVRAADYGVPQNRPRVLMVGIRNDVLAAIGPLTGTVAKGFLPEPSGNPPHPKDLLGDLVDDNFQYGGSTLRYPAAASHPVQKWLRTGLDGTVAKKGDPVTEHDYSNHAERIREKFQYMLDNDGRIPKKFQTKKFAQCVMPAQWDPKPTITATSLPDDYVHFSQARTLTVREWARLQGFPDYYQFAGSRTTGGLRRAGNPREGLFTRELPKYTQIGNAVPVWLAQAVGRHFAMLLQNAKARKSKPTVAPLSALANATPS